MFFLDHAWLVPLIPARLVRRDPAARQALPAPRRRGRHRRGRRVVRPVVRRDASSGSTGCRTPTTRTAPRACIGALGRSIGRLGAGGRRGARAARSIHQLTWFENAGTKLTVGTQIDGLAVMMMFVVTLISLLVHVYSLEYMRGDRRFTHFYAALSLFTASMLLLVVAEQHAADARRLGARRPLLVHADRALVGGEAELRRRAQGVPHHAYRRHRAARSA